MEEHSSTRGKHRWNDTEEPSQWNNRDEMIQAKQQESSGRGNKPAMNSARLTPQARQDHCLLIRHHVCHCGLAEVLALNFDQSLILV